MVDPKKYKTRKGKSPQLMSHIGPSQHQGMLGSKEGGKIGQVGRRKSAHPQDNGHEGDAESKPGERETYKGEEAEFHLANIR